MTLSTPVRTQQSAMVRRVHERMRQQKLCVPGEAILVAVSGGPDSVALLHVLQELAPIWKLRLSVVHVNYGLRGAESEEDTLFVADLCRSLSVPFYCESITLSRPTSRRNDPADKANSSLQARAREARYSVFRRIALQTGATKVALGHTADDQAETLLLWMLRGAGTTGLAGIPQIREGTWIRPLLEVCRDEILSYLRDRGVGWRMDSSNAKPVYARNRIRLRLMPVLKELSPSVSKVLSRQASILREEDRCLEELAIFHLRQLIGNCPGHEDFYLDRNALTALAVALQRRVVRAMVRTVTGEGCTPTFGAVEAIRRRVIEGRSGSVLNIAGVLVWRDYERVGFRPWQGSAQNDERQEPTFCHATANPVQDGDTVVPWTPARQVIRIRVRESAECGVYLGERPVPTRVVLDADRIVMPIGVRSWQAGDWFQPAGMGGRRKKLQDFFSDLKIPRNDRHRVPLLIGGDQILWVVGHRADHRAQVTSTSRRLLIAELEEAPEKRSGG